jgi:hypothetical protein
LEHVLVLVASTKIFIFEFHAAKSHGSEEQNTPDDAKKNDGDEFPLGEG